MKLNKYTKTMLIVLAVIVPMALFVGLSTLSNWPNSVEIAWSSKKEFFSHINQIIFFFVPWVGLAIIWLLRKQLAKIDIKIARWIWTGMGAFAISWELSFDIDSIILGHHSSIEQFKSGFDLCRLNTYVIGSFLIFQKIEWVKWTVATALFGGTSTLFDHYDNHAAIHSLVTHTIILPMFPAFTIAMSRSNYTFKSYVYSHLFNWSIVAFLIITNYQWTTDTGEHLHAGELNEAHLKDNVLVGSLPYGARMLAWIFVVMVVEFIYFAVFRYVYWQTFETKQVKRTLFSFNVFNKTISFNTYKRENSYFKLFAQDFKWSIKQIPYGPKNTFISARNNVQQFIKQN